MPSPFPGMNPYLERASVWSSFHPHFISLALEHIAAQIRPKYIVQIETRLYIHEPPAEQRFRAVADLGVKPRLGSQPASGGTATIAPAYVTLGDAVEIERVQSLTVRDREGNELVTVIELLSPANKYAGPDREQYLGKRNEILRSRTHLVEIDLLRGGPRMPPDDLPTCDYCALASRIEERPRAGVWPWRLRDPMPVVPIPLKAGDADAQLNLKAVIDHLYDVGGYEDYIYSGLPEPRLSPDDMTWASQFLPAKS
ncbi:MAG: hypothetical protein C0467_11325 [Planctomycetaceae bacterium]|nr:hypothetical protein [Planctomycetaceae bacterium]